MTGAGLLDRGARIREGDVLIIDSGALGGRNVGDEHIGESGVALHQLCDVGWHIVTWDSIAFLAAAGNRNRCAVHVHLAITDLVEPGPSQSVLSWFDALGNLILEL